MSKLKSKLREECSKDFSKSVFYKIEQLAIYIDKMSKDVFSYRNVDITKDEIGALNFIIYNPNICQRDLAKLLLRDRVRTGRILNSLEEKGYIKRVNDTKNNRLVRRLTVTKSGEKFYNEQFEFMSKLMDKLLENFSEEKMIALRESLENLEEALSDVIEFNI